MKSLPPTICQILRSIFDRGVIAAPCNGQLPVDREVFLCEEVKSESSIAARALPLASRAIRKKRAGYRVLNLLGKHI